MQTADKNRIDASLLLLSPHAHSVAHFRGSREHAGLGWRATPNVIPAPDCEITCSEDGSWDGDFIECVCACAFP